MGAQAWAGAGCRGLGKWGSRDTELGKALEGGGWSTSL